MNAAGCPLASLCNWVAIADISTRTHAIDLVARVFVVQPWGSSSVTKSVVAHLLYLNRKFCSLTYLESVAAITVRERVPIVAGGRERMSGRLILCVRTRDLRH